MSEDTLLSRPRHRAGAEKATPWVQYTAKDFQLEVLGQLAEVQEMTESLRESIASEIGREREQSKHLRFDGRTLVAIGALALSITGYILQDARNTSKRDAEMETMKSRVTRLEEIAAANTEGRIRTEVQLGELREGQVEIKRMIEQRASVARKAAPQE